MSDVARHRHRRPSVSRLLGAGALLLALAAPAASAQPLLRHDGEGYAVEVEGGRLGLPLESTAEIGDLRPIRGGFLASAVERGEDGASRLVLVRGRGARVETLPAPAVAGRVREPRLVSDERLRGLVWLEGDALTRLAVRAAVAEPGGGWSVPVTVSPPGPGSQLGLAAVALADGSWLAAWAAYDGTDHEILWSRFSDGAWSPPAPAAAGNEVPDVTPALQAASGGGAWLAWAGFDGEGYRVHLARFADGRFGEPRAVGPRGSLHPAFSEAGLLLYQRAVPRAWVAAELDGRGEVRRTATVEAASAERPVVVEVDGGAVTLQWPDGASASAAWKQD